MPVMCGLDDIPLRRTGMCAKRTDLVVCVLGLGLVLTSLCHAADPSLVGWWKLDDASGTVARDASGRGHDGTLRGGPTWVIGRVDGALLFDGVDDCVDVGSVGIRGADERTVLAWVKASTPTIADKTSVFGFVPDGSMEGTYFDMEVDDKGNYVAHICGYQWALGAVDTQWHHIAGTYGGGTGCWYLDGQFIDSAEGDIATIDHVKMGARLSSGRYFPGLLDDVRIYSRVLTETEIRSVMEGTDLGQATDPGPAEGAMDVPRDVVLSWTPDASAVRHDVYFGTSWDDVLLADTADPRNVLVSHGQVGTTFDSDGLLAFGRTYYWRVDGIGAPPDSTVFRGRVWDFTSESFAYPIENVTATASHASAAGPENTVNGSGMDADDLHSMDAADMWLAAAGPEEPVWIQYDFDRVYKLHQMQVWNYNVEFELLLGFGLKDVTVEYSRDGADWAVLGDVEFAQATVSNDYAHNTVVDFAGAAARCVRFMVHSNFGAGGQYGLSEVRFLHVPVHACRPQPADGAADVDPETTLHWCSGREAASHEVRFGTDPETLVLAGAVGSAAFAPADLEFARTYYWQVVEVNEAEAIREWAGSLWSFTTQAYRLIDGFESYTDDIDAGQAIFDTWLDGWANNTGSTVGYLEAPFAEQTIVHSGRQSMPLQYDNSLAPFYSEAQRPFDSPQDWTIGGADSLRLYFQGSAANATQTLYVALEDNAGRVVAVSHTDPEAVRAAGWQSWQIPLSQFAGVDLSRVRTMYIGLGHRTTPTAGGSGLIYIDDIGFGKLATDP